MIRDMWMIIFFYRSIKMEIFGQMEVILKKNKVFYFSDEVNLLSEKF